MATPLPFSAAPLFRACASLTKHEIQNSTLSRLILAEASRDQHPTAPALDLSARMAAIKYGLSERQAAPERQRETRCLEQELSAALERELPGAATHGGCLVPLRLTAAGLDTKSAAAGANTISTVRGEIIDALVAQSRVLSLGATLAQLRGSFSYPRELTVSAASWVEENSGADVGESDETFDQVAMSPKMLSSTTSFSRKLLEQSSTALQQWVAARLTRAHSLAIDVAAINGSGTGNEPTGLLGSGIGSVAIGVNGGVPTAAHIAALIRTVADAGSDFPDNAFLSTPEIREKLSSTAQFTTWGDPVWSGSTMLGYRAEVSSNVPDDLTKGTSSPPTAGCHAIIFGYWPSLIVGEWGVLELVVDPYAKKKQGMIEVTSYECVDIGVRNPLAFAAIVDAKKA